MKKRRPTVLVSRELAVFRGGPDEMTHMHLSTVQNGRLYILFFLPVWLLARPV